MDTKNQNGFSLVMVIIGIASISIIALIVAEMSSSMFRYGANINVTLNSRGIMQTLSGVISYPNLCAGSLPPGGAFYDAAAAASTGGMKMSIDTGPEMGVLADGTDLPRYGLRIRTLRFKVLGPATPDWGIPGNQLYTGTLLVQMNKLGALVPYLGGNEMKEKVISTMVLSVTPATNRITNCYSLSGAREACVELGGTYTPSGNPQCKLPYPCLGAPDKVFTGYDANTGAPKCFSASEMTGQSCPANQFLVSNGDGTARCQSL